jgi:P pilus assembly chaperone PapD
MGRVARLLKMTAYRAGFLCCACLISVCLITSAKAMSVKPVVLELAASGSKSQATFRVFNDSPNVMPVEITSHKLEIDENGGTTTTPADGQFIIFPPRVAIQPGKSQTIQVRWLGKPNIPKSEIFKITANQLPVNFSEGKNGVNIVFSVSILLNVSPEKAQAKLELVSANVVEDNRKNKTPLIEIENTGNRHAMVTQTNLIFKSGKWRKKLTPANIFEDLGSFGLIPPGNKRRLQFKTILPPETSSFDVDIQLPEAR